MFFIKILVIELFLYSHNQLLLCGPHTVNSLQHLPKLNCFLGNFKSRGSKHCTDLLSSIVSGVSSSIIGNALGNSSLVRLIMGFPQHWHAHPPKPDCLVHTNIHCGSNTIGSNMFGSVGDVILCLFTGPICTLYSCTVYKLYTFKVAVHKPLKLVHEFTCTYKSLGLISYSYNQRKWKCQMKIIVMIKVRLVTLSLQGRLKVKI